MRAALSVLMIVAMTTPAIAAPTREECIAASEDAQLKKMNGQLRSAREKLVVCSSEGCPKVVKKDCSSWLDEVDRALPTVVFGVRDASGADLTDVRVSMDGAPLADHLDGKAVAVDPGQHTFKFESGKLPAREEKIVVREGEKNRIVSVTLGEHSAQRQTGNQSQDETQNPPTGETPMPGAHGPSIATWIVGGVGLAMLAGAGGVGIASLIHRNDLYNSCGSTGSCQQSDVDAVYLMYNISYIGAAVGSALVVTSVILFFATRSSGKAAVTTGVTLSPTLGGLSLSGRF